MQNKQINWSEGLLLRPHHFQAADRYWHELIHLSSSLDNGHNYGVHLAELNEQSLEQQVLELVRFRGRTQSGTVIAFEDSTLDRLDLNKKLESDSKFVDYLRDNGGAIVYLAIPDLKLSDQPNVTEGQAENNSHIRYRGGEGRFEDESGGGNLQSLKTRKLNLQFLFQSDNLNGYEVIPLFRLIRSAKFDGRLIRDPEYYPPCMTTGSYADLKRDVMEAAYDLLNTQGNVLRQQIVEKGTTFATQIAGEVDRLMLLRTINEGLAGLNSYTFSSGVHPFDAYVFLCQLIGKLSIFGRDKSNGDMKRYDHENLYEIFQWALDRIRQLVNLGDEGYFQRYFKGIGRAKLNVNIEPRWFSDSWQLILGINSVDLEARECLETLGRTVAWKLAHPSRVDFCYERQARGLTIHRLKNIPNVLPKTAGWSFFTLAHDEIWDEVKAEKSIGLRINSQQIKNLKDLDNQQTIHLTTEKVDFRVEFAIFAVKEGN